MTENTQDIPEYDLYWKKKSRNLKDITFSGDGNHLIAGSDDGRIFLYDRDGNEIWQQNLNSLNCLAASGGYSKIAIGNFSGSLYMLSKDGRCEWERKLNGSINSISISRDGKNICVGTDKGIIIDYDDAGVELWKHKITGAADGGICHSHDGKYIAAGSWDTIFLFSADGRIIWKFKLDKKVISIDAANDASLIVACTKGKISFIGNEGKFISENITADGFKSVSICSNYVYAISSNKIHIFNTNGKLQTTFETPENLLKICANSKDFLLAISQDRIYMFSALIRPYINILTGSLTVHKRQSMKLEIINSGPKDFDDELELRSNGLSLENPRLHVKVLAHGKSTTEFRASGEITGKYNVEFFAKNKKIRSDIDTIEIIPPKLELDISHHPKYEFNAEDDEITMVIDIENNSEGTARNIRIEDDNNLLLPELKPLERKSVLYRIKLPSGERSLSKNIIYEDECGKKFVRECTCQFRVEKAPYVWGMKPQAPKMITGKTEIIKFDIKNINRDKDVMNLIFHIMSEKMDIKPDSRYVQLKYSESQEMEFTFMPRESGEKIKFTVIIEYDGKKQKYEDEIHVFAGPPHIIIKNHLAKDKYLIGEDICETLELLNDGESAAKNIQIDGIPGNIPILEPKALKSITRKLQNNEIKYYRSIKNRIKYEDDLRDYAIEFDSRAYTVSPPGLNIKASEINLLENIKKEVKFEITNVSNELMKDISVELSINDDKVILDKRTINIESISPADAKPAIFQCSAGKEGVVDFTICAKHQGVIIASHTGTFTVGSRMPVLLIEADDSTMVQNEHSLLKIKITNTGEMEARDVHVKLHCENDNLFCKEISPLIHSELKEIKPDESKTINLGFYPENSGKIFLIIKSSCKSIYGKELPEKKTEFICTIRPHAQKPEKQIIVGGDYFDGGGTKLTDSVVQKSHIGQNAGNVEDSIVQKTSPGSDRKNIEKYRALCIQALEDGKITAGERDILNNEAVELGLSESEKKQIEDEIAKNKGQSANTEAYRRQVLAAFKKGRITGDEREMLDVSRKNYGLTRELQKQIEKEVLAMLSKDNIIVVEETCCPQCGKTILKGNFCTECGKKGE